MSAFLLHSLACIAHTRRNPSGQSEGDRGRGKRERKRSKLLTKSYRDLSRCIGIGPGTIAEAQCPPFALHLGNHLAVEEAEQRGHAQTLRMRGGEKKEKV